MTALPRRTPGENGPGSSAGGSTADGPLWWATEVDAWDTDEADPKGRTYRGHRWVRYADDGSELARIDVYEDVYPDGRHVFGPDLLFTSEVVADATDPADIRAVAEALEAASSLLYAMAERGVDGGAP